MIDRRDICLIFFAMVMAKDSINCLRSYTLLGQALQGGMAQAAVLALDELVLLLQSAVVDDHVCSVIIVFGSVCSGLEMIWWISW
jgi:hypothetical protein